MNNIRLFGGTMKTRIKLFADTWMNKQFYMEKQKHLYFQYFQATFYHDCIMIVDNMIVRLILCTRVCSLWVQSSMLQMTTGQHTWCRMKSLVLPRIVLLITPTPLVPVTTNLGFASLMNSVIAYSGFKSTLSIRISTSIWKIEKIKCLINLLRNNVRHIYDLHLREKNSNNLYFDFFF